MSTDTRTDLTTSHPVLETVPESWDSSRDETFFRICGQLFASDFTYGASVLLSSYDAD